jgi:hypothetical protein
VVPSLSKVDAPKFLISAIAPTPTSGFYQPSRSLCVFRLQHMTKALAAAILADMFPLQAVISSHLSLHFFYYPHLVLPVSVRLLVLVYMSFFFNHRTIRYFPISYDEDGRRSHTAIARGTSLWKCCIITPDLSTVHTIPTEPLKPHTSFDRRDLSLNYPLHPAECPQYVVCGSSQQCTVFSGVYHIVKHQLFCLAWSFPYDSSITSACARHKRGHTPPTRRP